MIVACYHPLPLSACMLHFDLVSGLLACTSGSVGIPNNGSGLNITDLNEAVTDSDLPLPSALSSLQLIKVTVLSSQVMQLLSFSFLEPIMLHFLTLFLDFLALQSLHPSKF